MITELPFGSPFNAPFDAPFNGKTFEQQLISEGAKLILSAPKASGTATLTGVQSPWVDLSAGYDVALTNAVVNGDFANGVTGWSNDGGVSVLSAISNKLSVVGSGTSMHPRAIQATPIAYSSGKKIEASANIKILNSSCLTIAIDISATGMSNLRLAEITNPVNGTLYKLSGIGILTAGGSGNITVRVVSTYGDPATANGKVMEVQEVMCIDLTTAFTATREPLLADIQQAMTKAGTTFWNGAKTLKFTNNATGSNFGGTATSGWVTDILPCDTGVEHEIVNGLGALGDFEGSDLSGWLLLGTPTISLDRAITGTKSVKIVATGQEHKLYKDVISTIGNKIYTCGYKYISSIVSGGLSFAMFDYSSFSNPASATMSVATGSWDFFSVEKQLTTKGYRLFYGGTGTANLTAYFDSIISIDKTLVFGAGKEPTQAQMDRLVQWMIARFGYVNTKVLKLAWRSMQRLDGTDDFDSITNSASMDLGVVVGEEFAIGFTARVAVDHSGTAFLIAKNSTDAATMQYGVSFDPVGKSIALWLNGGARKVTSANTVLLNEFYNVVVHRNSIGEIRFYVNKALLGTPTTYADVLVTAPNIRLGKREGGSCLKHDRVTSTAYRADTLDIAKILDLEWKIARDYIYTGV